MIDWKKTILKTNVKIQDVVNNLNETSMKIVLIVDSKNFFKGVISDGDIRRGILKGLKLDSSISTIIRKNPITAKKTFDQKKIIKIMNDKKVQQIPIIENRKLIGLHLNDNYMSTKIKKNTIFIMAGGFGKRLKPYTDNIPKPLLEIKGKPILQHIIEKARNEGFINFTISVNYLADKIINYFGNGKKFGISIKYVKEKKPLGTAGALSLLKLNNNQTIIVTNGDVLTDISFEKLLNFHNYYKSSATMSIINYEWTNPFGVVLTRGNEIIDIKEKPINESKINAGLYAFSPSSIKYLKNNNKIDMPEFFMMLKKNKKKITACPIYESWQDIGNLREFKRAKKNK